MLIEANYLVNWDKFPFYIKTSWYAYKFAKSRDKLVSKSLLSIHL